LIGKKPLDLTGSNGRRKIQGQEVQQLELSIMKDVDRRLFLSKGSIRTIGRKGKERGYDV
jgi:hypothetical protein